MFADDTDIMIDLTEDETEVEKNVFTVSELITCPQAANHCTLFFLFADDTDIMIDLTEDETEVEKNVSTVSELIKYNTEEDYMIKEENFDGMYSILQSRVRIKNLFFLFLNQNICCGYSKEPSQ